MRQLVERLSLLLESRALKLTAAESCTGGMIAAAITARPGSSALFECGFVTYSNRAKTIMLGVPEDILNRHGAVSAQTAQAMASGALERSGADIALSVTGIAGPTGATQTKPVGLVFIGIARRSGDAVSVSSFEHRFSGDRAAVREASTRAALEHGIKALQK